MLRWTCAIGGVVVGCQASAEFRGLSGDAEPALEAPESTEPNEPGPVPPPAPPEDELTIASLPPSQTDVYVFVPNPDRNTVTRIHVDSLTVDTAPVGIDPQIVQTTPDFTTAVVFNRGDDTVSILDTDTLDEQRVDVRENLNDLRLSPDGQWAVLWRNRAVERPDDPPVTGLQSFNEASFVHLPSGVHTGMAVGFNPRDVVFTPDGNLAVVVADAYLATVDLSVNDPSPTLIELTDDVQTAPRAEEVVLASDGSFAWVRQFGATELLVVDLATGAIETVPAGLNPTDLDLSADGLEAIALARGSQELLIFQADDPALPPREVPLPLDAAPYGSFVVDPNDERGLLYTTATLVERYAVWDRLTDDILERPLVKPVDGIALNPTGETALVFHSQEDGIDTEPLFAGSWAITLIAMDDQRTNPLKLPSEPVEFANSNDGAFGFFVMDGEPLLEILDYATLLHDERELRSVPQFLGVLPDLSDDGDAPPAWVSQEHPLGRISFYDPDDDTLETLTGFELNSEIE